MALDERIVKIGEYEVNLGSKGNGKTVLLLHDISPSSSMKDLEPLFVLSSNHMILAPDLVGFGKSSKKDEIPNYKVQANVVSELLDRVNVHEFSAVGLGWGGQICIQLALMLRKNMVSMVLINPTYEKEQLSHLRTLEVPTLILFSEDNMFVQLKTAYTLRDMIKRSRLEVIPKTKLLNKASPMRNYLPYTPELTNLISKFLLIADDMILPQPEMENELKGIAQKEDELP